MSSLASHPPLDAATTEGVAMLAHVAGVLAAEGVTCWLDAGACLRAVRNGVPWSTDVDLGMWHDDREGVLRAVARLRSEGFQARFQGGMPYVDDHVALHPPIGAAPPFTNIDLGMYRRLGDEAVKLNSGMPLLSQPFARTLRRLLMTLRKPRFSGRTPAGRLGNLTPFALRKALWRLAFALYRGAYRSVCFVAPRSFFEELRELRIGEATFFAPREAEAYLAYRYGEDWIAPKPGWRFSDGQILRIRPMRGLLQPRRLRFVESDAIVWHRRVTPRGSFEFTPEEVRRILARDLRATATPR
jgi:hypothetical protein